MAQGNITRDRVNARATSDRPDLISRILFAPVLLLLGAIIRKAWLDLDTAWDALAYHLPCAALRIGILSEWQYQMSPRHILYLKTFPVLPDYLQGSLWWLTSHVQAANFINLLGLLTLVIAIRAYLRIPLVYSLLSFLAVPVVLIQSTSSYIDLFANSFITIMLLTIFSAMIFPEHFTFFKLISFFMAFTVTLNSKIQLVPAATIGLFFLISVLYINRRNITPLILGWRRKTVLSKAAILTIIIALTCSGYVNELRNWYLFNNPAYPAALSLGPIKFDGPVSGVENFPAYIVRFPQWVRWSLSMVEYKSFEGRNPLWTNGQGDVSTAGPALFMGGFFGALVLVNLLWLALLQTRLRERFGWKPSLFFCFITFTAAFSPASQQTRYYIYWILCLISVNLCLIVAGLSGNEAKNARVLYLGTMASFLIFILCANGFTYVRSTGTSVEVATKGLGIDDQLSNMHLTANELVCVVGKNPLTFLYAPIFHKRLQPYRVIEVETPSECGRARILQ